MKFAQTAFLSSIITLVRLASGFLTNKIIAVVLGAAGVALLGNFNNFITVVLAVGSGSIGNGVIKYTAAYKEDAQKSRDLYSTGFWLSVMLSALTGLVIILGSAAFSQYLFKTDSFSDVLIVLGTLLVFYSLNTLVLSIINGRGLMKQYTFVSLAGSLAGLALTFFLVYRYHLRGALYSIVLSQTVVFGFVLFLLRKEGWFSKINFTGRWQKSIIRDLSHFSLMAIISGILVPLAQFFIREFLTDGISLQAAGYWQALMKISDSYLMLANIALATYFLPKFSELTDRTAIQREVWNGYRLLIPMTLVSCIAIYLLRYVIIRILYTPEFFAMEPMFAWQLVGDFLKICAFILSYLMMSQSKTGLYIITEILFTIVYIGSSYGFIQAFGLVGSTAAFALTYALYFAVMLILYLTKKI